MYKDWIKRYKERDILRKIFLSTFGISVFFIIVVCFIGFSWLHKMTREQIVENDNKTLANYNVVFDNYVNSARQTAETLYKNVYVQRMIVKNETQWTENMSAIASSTLNTIKVNSQFHSIFIIGTEGILLRASNYSSSPEENIDGLANAVFPQALTQRLQIWDYRCLNGENEQLLAIAVGERLNSQAVPSGVMVNINIGSLTRGMFTYLQTGENYFIMDSKGGVLGGAGELFRFGETVDSDLYQRVVPGRSEALAFKTQYQGETYLVTYTSAKDYSYSIVHMLPYRYVLDPVNKIRNLILLIGIAMSAISLLLSTGISVRVYYPIGKFVDHVTAIGAENASSDGSKAKNELSAVSNTFADMASRLNQYSKAMETEQMVKYFANKYYRSRIPKDYEAYYKSTYPNAVYTVAVIRVSEMSDLMDDEEAKVLYDLKSICGIASNHYLQIAQTDMYVIDSEYIAVILIFPDKEEYLEEEVLTHSREVIDLVAGVGSFSLNIGLSGLGTEISELKQAYKIACAATSYRFLFGKNTAITASQMQACVFNQSEAYSSDNLLAAVRSGDEEAFQKEYEIMERYVKEHSIQVGYEVFIEAACEMYKIQAKIIHDNVKPDFALFETVKSEIINFPYIYEVRGWFWDLFTRIKNHRNQIQSTGAYEIISKAVQYINENFKDCNLNAQFLANHFGVTPSYFSRIFNDYANCAFPDYLSNVRLEYSMQMLVAYPQRSIQEICEDVGYTNASYFTALFKKRYGVTPGKYRLNNKITQES